MFARQGCNPTIGDEATKILSEFYVHLRQTNRRSNGSNPITMRQLESLQRLTQARAKIEMRTVCSGSDALEVIEIMKASMVDYYENELGMLDLTSVTNTTANGTTRKSTTIKQFVCILQKISEEKKDNMFNYDEIRALYEVFILIFSSNIVFNFYFYYMLI
jgi:DNA helicase MCM8